LLLWNQMLCAHCAGLNYRHTAYDSFSTDNEVIENRTVWASCHHQFHAWCLEKWMETWGCDWPVGWTCRHRRTDDEGTCDILYFYSTFCYWSVCNW
jgi:hypothetical protein